MKNVKRPTVNPLDTPVESPFFSPKEHERDVNIGQGHDEARFIALVGPSSSGECGNDQLQDSPLLRNCGVSRASRTISPSHTLSGMLLRLEHLRPRLIQEQVADDPWKLIIAVTLLNKTSGKFAVPAFWSIIEKWPTPLDLAQANVNEIISAIRHLGTQNVRAKRLIALSKSYMQEPPSAYDVRRSSRLLSSPRRTSRFFPLSGGNQYPATAISHLPGTGPYALDSYRIFCSEHEDTDQDEWKRVLPTDKELIRFLRWKWACVEGMEWTPTEGPIRVITEKYLSKLIMELENAAEDGDQRSREICSMRYIQG